LRFPNRYWTIDEVSFENALIYLSEPTIMISENLPMHPSAIVLHGREAEVLSLFGFMAPSMNTGGDKYVLNENKFPERLTIRTKVLTQAISDFRELKRTGVLVNNSRSLKGNYTDLKISVGRTDVMKGMVNHYVQGDGIEIGEVVDVVNIDDGVVPDF